MGRCLGPALRPQEPLSPTPFLVLPAPRTQNHPEHPPAAAAASPPAHAGARAGRWRRPARAASSARRPSLPTGHPETRRHLLGGPGLGRGKRSLDRLPLTLPLGSYMAPVAMWSLWPHRRWTASPVKPYLRYLPVVHLHERVHLNPQGLRVQHGVRIVTQPLWGKRFLRPDTQGPTPGPAGPTGIILHGPQAWRLWLRVQEMRKMLEVARTCHPKCQAQVSTCCSQGR